MSVAEYIKYLLSIEEYSFSVQEVQHNSSKNRVAIRRELSRLVNKNEIINLRKEFYLIIPPRYSSSGKLPLQLYVEKLFRFLKRNYYVGLHSAAKLYGASHQQIQKDYLITQAPKLNSIVKTPYDLQFLTTKTWPKNNLAIKKSDAGEFYISTPTLTFIDLIHHHTKIGGINRILPSLEELIEDLSEDDTSAILTWYGHKSTLQRAGYILDKLFDQNPIGNRIHTYLKQGPFYPVLLSPSPKQKPGQAKNRWKIDVNVELSSDLW